MFEADVRQIRQPVPTHIRLMGYRYVELRRTLRGLNCSGVPLVAFDGLRYRRAGSEDDPGLFFFVPEMARTFGLSLETAVDLTLIGAVLLAFLCGLMGWIRITPAPLGRRLCLAGLVLLTIVILIAGDVYVMSAVPALACVPWTLYFSSREKLTLGAVVTYAGAGALSQVAGFFRGYAGTGLILFSLMIAFGVYRMKPRARAVLLLALLLAGVGTELFFDHLFVERSRFLGAEQDAIFGSTQVHVFWHSVYIGLGYVKNSDVPAYQDEVAFAKVRSLKPGVAPLSREYEQVLKSAVIDLAKRRPFLIVENVVVKTAVILLFCVAAANIGLYASKLAPKPLWLALGFWLAIAFNGLFGILVIPNPKYLLGLIAFAALYGMYSVEYAAERADIARRLGWMRRLLLLTPEPAGRRANLSQQ